MKIVSVGEITSDYYLKQKSYYVGGRSLNFAVHAKRSGAETVSLVSCVGSRAVDGWILKLLEFEGVDHSRVAILEGKTAECATKCMRLLGEHHCITFQLHIQRKDESYKACRFWAPAECTLTVSRNFHSGGGCDVEVVRPQFCNKMHATAWRASLHHISTSHAKKR